MRSRRSVSDGSRVSTPIGCRHSTSMNECTRLPSIGASELGATARGKKQLASDLGRWERIVEAIGAVMYVKPEESVS
jgi:hypothetical protein